MKALFRKPAPRAGDRSARCGPSCPAASGRSASNEQPLEGAAASASASRRTDHAAREVLAVVAAERPEDPRREGGCLTARDGLLLTREYGPRGDLSRSPRTHDGAVVALNTHSPRLCSHPSKVRVGTRLTTGFALLVALTTALGLYCIRGIDRMCSERRGGDQLVSSRARAGGVPRRPRHDAAGRSELRHARRRFRPGRARTAPYSSRWQPSSTRPGERTGRRSRTTRSFALPFAWKAPTHDIEWSSSACWECRLAVARPTGHCARPFWVPRTRRRSRPP